MIPGLAPDPESDSELVYRSSKKWNRNTTNLDRRPNNHLILQQTMLGDGTNITRQYTECIWEKDTDDMVWWPPEIKPCDGEFTSESLDSLITNIKDS